MEKNVYDIINEWHVLLKKGIITEKEFIAKKQELLNEENLANGNDNPSIDTLKENSPSIISQSRPKKNIFTNKHISLVIIGIICIGLASLYYFKYNKDDSYYKNILKDYIVSEWEKVKTNPTDNQDKVTNIRSEDGQLIIDSENFSLSVYDFKYATVLKGDLSNDAIPEIIITNIENQGGGAGGNVVLKENYILKKISDETYEIRNIEWELIDVPKTEYGYEYWIEEIKNGFVIIRIAFYKADELNYPQSPQGEKIELKCKLIYNQLKVVE